MNYKAELKIYTEQEKKAEAFRRLRTIIDNKNLRDRQSRIYEIRRANPSMELGENMKALLKAENLNWD